MKGITAPLQIGNRKVLAMTCWKCGRFCQSSEFKRYYRKGTDKVRYVDRRCSFCRWSHLERTRTVNDLEEKPAEIPCQKGLTDLHRVA